MFSPYFLQGYKSLLSSATQSTKKSKFKLMEQAEEGVTTRPTSDAKLLTTVSQLQSLYSSDSEHTLLGSLPDIGVCLFVTIDPPIEPIPGAHFSQKVIMFVMQKYLYFDFF